MCDVCSAAEEIVPMLTLISSLADEILATFMLISSAATAMVLMFIDISSVELATVLACTDISWLMFSKCCDTPESPLAEPAMLPDTARISATMRARVVVTASMASPSWPISSF